MKSSKPVIKAVAAAGGTAKGGSIGGLIASKLTDVVLPDEEEKPPPKPKMVRKGVMKEGGKLGEKELKSKKEQQQMKTQMGVEKPRPKSKGVAWHPLSTFFSQISKSPNSWF